MTRATKALVFLLATAAAVLPAAAQDEVYLKVTSPGLSRIVIGMTSLPARPGTDAGAASTLNATLRKDLDETAVVGLVAPENARLVVEDPKNPVLTRQRWRAVGAQSGRSWGASEDAPPTGPVAAAL